MARTSWIILGCSAAIAAAAMAPALSGGFDGAEAMQDALTSLSSGRLAEAERKALRIVAGRAGDAKVAGRAWLVAAAARQRGGDNRSAAEAYRKFLATCNSPDLRRYALEQIGNCRLPSGVSRAPRPPSRKLSVEDLRELAVVGETYHVESSEHFVVRTRNAKLAKLLVAEAESALERIRGLLLGEQEYPHAVNVYVWIDRKDFLGHAKDAPEWSGASFTFSVSDGVATRRIDLTQRGEDGRFAKAMLDAVLPHELCHLVLRELFGDAACPLVVNEGLAMMAEWRVDNDRVLLAGAALAGERAIPLEELLVIRRSDLDDPGIFYAEAFSFMSFLRARLTAGQFRSFLDHTRNGCGIGESLQRALYVPQSDEFMPALNAAWEDYALAHAQYLKALDERGELPVAN